MAVTVLLLRIFGPSRARFNTDQRTMMFLKPHRSDRDDNYFLRRCSSDWSEIKRFEPITVGIVLLVQRHSDNTKFSSSMQIWDIAAATRRGDRAMDVFHRREEITNYQDAGVIHNYLS